MDQLKLKYVIELVSNLGDKAQADAKKLIAAQDEIRKRLEGTNREIGLMERALLKIGGVGSASANRQADYLLKLAQRYREVRTAAEGAAEATLKVVRAGAGLAAGGVAGAYTADRLMKAPMEYSTRLAHMANTAFSDRDVAGRVQGKAALDAAIRAALRTGGGTRDDAAETLGEMIASGVVPTPVAMRLLPSLMRAGTASGAPASQLGLTAVRAMQTMGLTEAQIPEALNMAMVAGQKGGFELKDMAKWLPEAMAMAKPTGLTGIEGFRRILGLMQTSVITAATKDAAGNNVVNLLGKINSADTARDFAKLGYDLPNELVRARKAGVNGVDAFMSFVDQIAMKDKQYAGLRKQLDVTQNKGERNELLESMVNILEGKGVVKTVQDRQAMSALLGAMGNRQYGQSVLDATRNDTTAIGTAFGVMSQETGFARQQAINEGQIASTEAMNQLAPSVRRVFEGFVNLAQENPKTIAALTGLAGAATVAAAALGASGIAGLLLGRGAAGAAGATGAAGTVGRVAGAAGVVGAATGLGPTGAGVMAMLRKAGGLPALLASELFFTSDSDMAVLRQADARRHHRGAGFNDPRLLALTQAPATNTNAQAAMGAVDRAALGQGVLDVRIRVDDERVSATSSVGQPMSLIRINPGFTNPGSAAR